MRPKSFEYHRPETLKEASEILYSNEDAKALAGGQSLIPLMKLRIYSPEHIVSLSRIKEINQKISLSKDSLEIGAMATHDMLATTDSVRNNFPLLSTAAAKIADQQIRNLGTIGGNIAHGDPSANLASALLSADTEVLVYGQDGKKAIPINDFFQDLFTTSLEPGDIVTGFRISLKPGYRQSFLKISKSDTAFPIAFVASNLKVESRFVEDARISLGVAGPTPIRAEKAEKFLVKKELNPENISKAAKLAVDGTEPPDDIHASTEYRRHLLEVLVKRTLEEISTGGKR